MKSELQIIDEGLTRAVNRARRAFLVRQLGKYEITEINGRPLELVDLDVLEDAYQIMREEK